MRYKKLLLIVLFIIGVIFTSCSDLKNDITSPTKIGVHGASALDQSSSSFHGIKVKTSGGLKSCRQCHSADLNGGTAQVSCTTSNCHPAINVHQAGINDTLSSEFHGKYIAAINWDLKQCTQCHGNDYAGGVASPTCKTCHTNSAGPEACNTCHGNFKDPNYIAPPNSVDGTKDTNDPGAGAHSTHLYNVKITSNNVACAECHIVPTSFNSAGHINANGKAQVIFGAVANYGGVNSSYDFSTNKCSNTWCHGNFAFSKANSDYPTFYTADKIEGENFSPQWNKVDGSQAKCGTCHGLPPKGHVYAEITGCIDCHPGVVDKYGNIADKTKHMNGKIDVFGN
jgi:hypothetical protein